MKYVFVLLTFLLFGCDQPAFEVGACKEFSTHTVCTPSQLAKNRMMIDQCTYRGNSYNYCVDNLSSIGCMQKKFVVCRESESKFISFENEAEVITDTKIIEELKAVPPQYTPAMVDTTQADWYNNKE